MNLDPALHYRYFPSARAGYGLLLKANLAQKPADDQHLAYDLVVELHANRGEALT